jgi:two-component system response regulator LytT
MSFPYKVLIVEDDPFQVSLIVSDLEQLFPNGNLLLLKPATNFDEALKAFQSDNPDIALLDIELGNDKRAGINLAHHFNQIRPIPIVFLSGLERSDGFEVAKFTAPYGFLRKPYFAQELGDLLELILVKLNQLKGSIESNKNGVKNGVASIFVSTSYSELTALPIAELALLEADGKLIRAYLTNQEKAIIFTSPGLKNFFMENKEKLGEDFFQLSRKHVIRLSKIQQIKNNHVRLPKYSSQHSESYFSLPIPVNGNSKRDLLRRLGRKDE